MRSLPFAFAAVVALVAAPLAAAPQPLSTASPAGATASAARLSAATRGDLTCAAAFAIAASEQQRGTRSALALPPLRLRGREFFVRIGAMAMDEARLSREAVRDLFESEVARMQARAQDGSDPDATLAQFVPPCLARLDAVVGPLVKPGLAQCAAIMRLASEELEAAEGLSARARDVRILASVLDAREREALKAMGRSGDEADRAMSEHHDKMVSEAAAEGLGVERYDLQTCYDLARPDEKKHY